MKKQEGCNFTQMTGSGPTCFGLFTSQEKADQAALQLQTIFPDYWIKASFLSEINGL